jgi:putative Ig domain-containing protein
MRLVPTDIAKGWYTDEALSWAAMRTVNYLPEAAESEGTRTMSKLATPPGLRVLVDLQTNAPVRGIEDVEGRLFAVSGESLFEITSDLTKINRGTIPGVGRVSMAHNKQGGATASNEIAIANSLSGYVYNTSTTTLAQITDSAFEGASTFDYADGFMTFTDPQGRFWGHSDLNQATSYSSIDRYDAESAPDKITSHIVSHREVIVWGPRTGEFFRNTGAATGTFQRVDGTEMEVGICATFARARVDNTVCWVGNDLTVYRLGGHAPQRISTRPIEQMLAKVDPNTIFCYAWEDRGHKVFYVTSPNNFTLGFDFASGLWHERQSYGLDQWRINALTRWNGLWVAGDYVNGLLYALDWDVYTENGRPMVSEAATGYTVADQNKVIAAYVELIFDTGGAETAPPSDLTLTGDVPGGTVGDPVTTSYVAAGGILPYTYSVASGTFPPGLSLNALTGAVTGSFTTGGSYSWVVEVVDGDGNTATVPDTSVVVNEWLLIRGSATPLKRSPDGTDWSAAFTATSGATWTPSYPVRIKHAAGKVLAVTPGPLAGSDGVFSADEGSTWASTNISVNAASGDVAWSTAFWFVTAGGGAGTAPLQSADGVTFTPNTSGMGNTYAICKAGSYIMRWGPSSGAVQRIDLNGNNLENMTALPVGQGDTVPQTMSMDSDGSIVGFLGLASSGSNRDAKITSSSNFGSSYTIQTNPFPTIVSGAAELPLLHWSASLNQWFAVFYNRVSYGPTLATLALSPHVLANTARGIDSDSTKIVICGDGGMLESFDLTTWTTLTSGTTDALLGVVALMDFT